MVSGAGARRKGHDWERAVATLLRTCFPDARRGIQSRDPRAADVEGTPFRIECKRLRSVKGSDVLAALYQVKQDGERYDDDRPAVVITKEDQREGLVHMTLDTFVTLVERFFWRQPEPADIIPFPVRNTKE